MEKLTNERYQSWLKNLETINNKDYKVLKDIKDEDVLNDMFYRELEFGTGGLRGIMGIGTNRMNIYTVSKASFGFASYLNNHYKNPSIAIGYDSRNNSQLFARQSAAIFASRGIKTYIYKELEPTPCLSYAVRELKCSGGIIITASHNPGKYNGYKVYNDEGQQITLEAANEVIGYISKIDEFQELKTVETFEDLMIESDIEYINDLMIEDFIEDTLAVSITKDFSQKDVHIVYTPLNGTGLKPVMKTLKKAGFSNVIVPIEQENPDGNFPTCPYPNPEILEAMQVGIKLCKKTNADLLIATDPDCDRCGIGVNYKGDFKLLSGNEVAILLLDFIANQEKLPNNPVAVRSVVSSSAVDKVAKKYGIEMRKVLTGFKFIGEQICELEKANEINRYIFGFEESYGYLTNVKVRDKDAVNASLIIAEMFNFYHERHINLIDKLYEIYSEIGFYNNSLITDEFPGEVGMKIMQGMMDFFHQESADSISKIFGSKLITKYDYLNSIEITNGNKIKINLPSSDVLTFVFEDRSSITIRPSGTEPKIKTYIEVVGSSLNDSLNEKETKTTTIKAFYKSYLESKK
ncbi:MAG: phospho-sugar mutase [Erysipelotrichaceae bacterium]|nr:phospho-sugar mutase [Erysipelotrichaceae bacterium]